MHPGSLAATHWRLAPDTSRTAKLKLLAGFGAFYLLFIAAWSSTFKAWWPSVAFAWLLVGKVVVALDKRRPAQERMQRMQSEWALSAIAYLAGVCITVFVPMPRPGISDALSPLDLPGSGLWVSKPHTVIAFGVLYFSVLVWSKWRDIVLPGKHLPANKAHGS